MQKSRKWTSKMISVFAVAVMFVTSIGGTSVFAAGYEDLDPGTYSVDASLSCFVTAMGGIEFGAPMLTSATVIVKENGAAEVTLSLQKSQVTIFGVTCDTFVDPNKGPIGYYDGDYANFNNVSDWKTASYTLSDDTALNADNQPVNYVDSITFPLTSIRDTYEFQAFINSNVMGVQFGYETASSSTRYHAILTVDWESVSKIATPDETRQQSAVVNYNVAEGYEVKIPATITVDPSSKTGSYEVEAGNFVVVEGAYVTVTADTSGSVTNGSKSIAFTNTLESGKLEESGDKLNGTVTITGSATAAGSYSGTLDFTINYFAE